MSTIPHSFVLDLLYECRPQVKRMFGVHSVYIGELLVLATRQNEEKPYDNGIWIGTEVQYHDELKAEIPSLTHLQVIPIKKWLLLPEECETFEQDVQRICEMIKSKDPRIGVTSKKKR